MTTNNLEERIKKLENIEAIKQLKYEYAEGCDLLACEKKLEPLLKVFTVDAIWDGADFGRHVGKEAIKEFLVGIPTMLTYAMHYFTNPRIEVVGNQAKGRYYLLAFFTDTEGQDLVLIGIENDEYKKINGKWFISSMALTMHSQSPVSEGWHKAVMEKFRDLK